jgi:uncharacterized protein
MKIYDTVHGFIHFNEIESLLIDTELFQRLRYIHQLGISYMVYPGGTHTRFEHSLGTMHLASKIFDRVAREEDRDYWKQVVRLAALCHDLGHLPFSHVGEKELLGEEGHEAWTLKMIESPYLAAVWKKMEEVYPGRKARLHVAKFALGEKKYLSIRPEDSFSEMERIYEQIISGDFFGADRIDYLLRDAKATGLSYGLFDYMQLIEMLLVLPDERGRLTLGVEENGIASCEALLLARHFMQRRVYHYSSARAYSFHMARFMKIHYGNPAYLTSVGNYLSMSEADLLCALDKARKDPAHPGHEDALALFDRKKRFQAIHLPQEMTQEKLWHFSSQASIPSDRIHWELVPSSSAPSALSLPVLKKNKQIASAKNFSEISIPPTQKSWLYLAPQYTFTL